MFNRYYEFLTNYSFEYMVPNLQTFIQSIFLGLNKLFTPMIMLLIIAILEYLPFVVLKKIMNFNMNKLDARRIVKTLNIRLCLYILFLIIFAMIYIPIVFIAIDVIFPSIEIMYIDFALIILGFFYAWEIFKKVVLAYQSIEIFKKP